MRQRIAVDLAAVVAPAHHLPLPDHHRSDGDLPQLAGAPRLGEGLQHPETIFLSLQDKPPPERNAYVTREGADRKARGLLDRGGGALLLAAGALVLGSGTLILAAGAFILAPGVLILAAGTLVLGRGVFILARGALVLTPGTLILGSGAFILTCGTLDRGRGMLILGSGTLRRRGNTPNLPGFVYAC
ncbi:MAG TPA: hypothetical protein VIA62_20980 [Thermoanaerobaculia bacterium]|nr:hypothetical protein [Thermoanaerobaculia bacterium]